MRRHAHKRHSSTVASRKKKGHTSSFAQLLSGAASGWDDAGMREMFETYTSCATCPEGASALQNGNLGSAEFKAMLTDFGIDITDDELPDVIALFDNDGNGEITYDEFAAVMQAQEEAHHEIVEDEEKLRAVFNELSSDGGESLDQAKFVAYMEENGTPVTPERLAEIMSDFDQDKDGKIEYDEFILVLADLNGDERVDHIADKGLEERSLEKLDEELDSSVGDVERVDHIADKGLEDSSLEELDDEELDSPVGDVSAE